MSAIREKFQEVISKSHERSRNYGIEKERVFPRRILKEKEAVSNAGRNNKLIKVALPFMDILYDFLNGSGFFIILTDREGCILSTIGDSDVLHEAAKLNMVVGAYMDEKSIGTNAMGTAIKEDMPIQISATEHFITAYHRWTCSAAPIHDTDGRIIGSLNITGQMDKVHPHTLGLVVASVKSIEYQIREEAANRKLFEAYQYINTIVDSISSGIYTIDANGIVKSINKTACALLGIMEEDIIEAPVDKILPNWSEIFDSLQDGTAYVSKESVQGGNVKNGSYHISVTPIKADGSIIGMVVVFKEMQAIYNLVNKYTGRRAIYTFDDIIGTSSEISSVIEFSRQISDSPSTVLIQGESGTGKELLAQAIHNDGCRCMGSFVAVNCGAIPKSLIESELFGYEEGAFTGARRGGHAGKFELANGGTLFLDEIGEMPLDMQVNLLRVLQEGYVTRVGGSKVIPIDVRIIAATNKDLKKEVDKGTFRSDLYYRLNVIPINLPALRERKGDLPYLIQYFLRMKSTKLSKPIPRIEDRLYESMLSYSWPGNIRELENYIENIVNFSGTPTIEIPGNNEDRVKDKSSIFHDEPLTLEEMERAAIVRCIQKFGGNMSRVSHSLGICRSTLYNKIKQYNINI